MDSGAARYPSAKVTNTSVTAACGFVIFIFLTNTLQIKVQHDYIEFFFFFFSSFHFIARLSK